MSDRSALAAAITAAASALADATADEMRLEDERPVVKQRAILALVGTDNPTNGKPHSASSAEAVVEAHADYAAHRLAQRDAVVARIMARGRYEAAVAAARLAGGAADA